MYDSLSPVAEKILRQYIARTSQMHEALGLPRIYGEVSALLYLYDGALNQDEIAEFLKVSKASVSTNLQALERTKFVVKVRIPGKRKDYYQFAGEMWSSVKEAFDSFIRNQVEDFRKMNITSLESLEADAVKGELKQRQTQHMSKQIRNLNQLYKFLDMISRITTMFRDKTPNFITNFFRNIT